MNLFLSLLACPQSNPKVKASCASHAFSTLTGRKSGNSLRLRQPDFLSSCSLLRRLTARGPWTNAEAFEARFLTTFGMTGGGVRHS
ncbi:hypothetical protein [Tannerella forsythia]|uniref:hypothetical protein n=1 Tax=Tannerella forsythia TaxID=28112 RepID=UPI0028EBCEA5|nr:hypothetical protein [Tannerella forsythia]